MNTIIIKQRAHTNTHRGYTLFERKDKDDVKYIGGYSYPKDSNTNSGSSAHFKWKASKDYDPSWCVIHQGKHRTVVNGVCLPCMQSKKQRPM